MKTPFAKRLAQALAADDRLEGEVAEAAGVLPSQLSSWKKGASPKTDHIERLVTALGINGHWLLTGEGSMELATNTDAIRLDIIGRLTDRGVEVNEQKARAIRAVLSPSSDAAAISGALADVIAGLRSPPPDGLHSTSE